MDSAGPTVISRRFLNIRSDALDAVLMLSTLTGLSRSQRRALGEKTARTLAASFEDSNNLKFWCWLIWQTLRARDQGQDWSDDVAHLIARVLHDIRQDKQIGNRKQSCPGGEWAAKLRLAGRAAADRADASGQASARCLSDPITATQGATPGDRPLGTVGSCPSSRLTGTSQT